jgi:UDP-N-acetyl-L-fucosamine synthase
MKLAIIVGTRPEIIRLSSTIKLAKKYFNTVLVHTGQNYDHNLSNVFFEDLDLSQPDYYLDCSRRNLGSTVGDIITKSYDLFLEIRPDAILILGDTNSCLCAYSAKRLKIPIFHVEAGNRCFDPNVPEEINRRLIDHISDVNMCYMEHARRNLLQEGLKSQYIFVIGSPMREVLSTIKDKINHSTILEKINVQPNEYFLLSVHREENISNNKNLENIIECINKISKNYNKIIVISLHPRTRKIITEKNINFDKNVLLCEPFGLIDYCKLQENSICVISDSGTLTEESSVLGFPAILLRNSTEHPEGIDSGNIILGDIVWKNLKINLKIAINKKEWNNVQCYNDMNVSEKICKIISGYNGIVNKFLWMK